MEVREDEEFGQFALYLQGINSEIGKNANEWLATHEPLTTEVLSILQINDILITVCPCHALIESAID